MTKRRLLAATLAVGAIVVLGACGNRTQSQQYIVKDPVACPGQAPLRLTWDFHIAAGQQGPVMEDPPECIHVVWKWIPGGLHWHTHTADIGIYRLITTTTTVPKP